MAQSFLKKLATPRTSQEKKMSPHELDLDRCIPVEIRSFEWVGSQIAAYGTDLRSGAEIMVFRTWPKNADGTRPNPLIEASDRISEGGVMLFTDVEEFTNFDDDRAIYSSGGFITVANGHSQSARVIDDHPVFIDPPETDPGTDRMSQLYNVIETDRAQPISDAHSFFEAMADAYKRATSSEDSVLIRGYSTVDGVASSIRVFIDPKKSFNDAMQEFLATDHYIDMVGTENGTFEVNGESLVGSLEGASQETHFEIIPVSGHRKGLSPKDKALRDKLQNAGHGLFQSFVFEGANNQFGFRQTTLALRSYPTKGGGTMEDIVGVFHESAEPRPLSLVSTANAPDLTSEIPGFSAEPVAYDEEDVEFPEQDFLSMIAEVVEEKNETIAPEPEAEIDFLGAAPSDDLAEVDYLSVIRDSRPREEASVPEQANDSEAETEIDFGLETFADLASEQPDDPAPVPEQTQSPSDIEGDEVDLDAIGMEPAEPEDVAPSPSEAGAEAPDDTIDLDVLDEAPQAAEPQVGPPSDIIDIDVIDPTTAQPEQAAADDIIDIDILDDPAASQPSDADTSDDIIDLDSLDFDPGSSIAADHDYFHDGEDADADNEMSGPARVRVQGQAAPKVTSTDETLDPDNAETVSLYDRGVTKDYEANTGVEAFLVNPPRPAPRADVEEPAQNDTSLASEQDTSPSSEASGEDDVDLENLDLDALSSALKF